MSMFMSVSYADQQSQASSNCGNSGLFKNWTNFVCQSNDLFSTIARESHRSSSRKNGCIFRIHFCAKLTIHSTVQWSIYDEVVHSPSVNVSYVIEFSFFDARAFPWLTR
jgi:hypothetical protein